MQHGPSERILMALETALNTSLLVFGVFGNCITSDVYGRLACRCHEHHVNVYIGDKEITYNYGQCVVTMPTKCLPTLYKDCFLTKNVAS